MPIVVLSAGRDHHLTAKRDQAMAAAGYKIVSATNSPEIINKLFNGDFDAVVLCNSIPDDERRRLARIIKSYSPSTPVIVLAETEGREYDYGTRTSSASPDGVVAALRQTFPRAASSVA